MLEAIERVTGGRPPGCPWRAFDSPFVGEVLDLYRAAGGMTEGGCVPARVLSLDPSHAAWQGLQHYTQAVALLRVEDAKERAREAQQQNAARKAEASMRRHG